MPYEPDRDIFGTLWQMKRAGPAGGGPAMKRITSRFVMLIATAAVLPLVIYGAVSIGQLAAGHRAVGARGQPARSPSRSPASSSCTSTTTRGSCDRLGEELSATSLAPWQQSRILKNHVLEFPEFREISILDASGRAVATSRLGDAQRQAAAAARRDPTHGVHVADVFLDDDALPTTRSRRLRLTGDDEQAGWLVGRLSLEELWRFVDRVRVGEQGYALVFVGGPAADRARQSRRRSGWSRWRPIRRARCRRRRC